MTPISDIKIDGSTKSLYQKCKCMGKNFFPFEGKHIQMNEWNSHLIEILLVYKACK